MTCVRFSLLVTSSAFGRTYFYKFEPVVITLGPLVTERKIFFIQLELSKLRYGIFNLHCE